VWRVVVMVLAGLAGYGLLVLLAWLEHESDAGSARQAERERQRDRAREASAASVPRRAGGPGGL
jgi:hypothetical protein